MIAVTAAERDLALGLVHRLRGAGHSVEYAFKAQGVGKQFKNASALGARRVLVLGPDEVAAGVAVLRDMESGEETRVPLESLQGSGIGVQGEEP